jgi:hypothetical protein
MNLGRSTNDTPPVNLYILKLGYRYSTSVWESQRDSSGTAEAQYLLLIIAPLRRRQRVSHPLRELPEVSGP